MGNFEKKYGKKKKKNEGKKKKKKSYTRRSLEINKIRKNKMTIRKKTEEVNRKRIITEV